MKREGGRKVGREGEKKKRAGGKVFVGPPPPTLLSYWSSIFILFSYQSVISLRLWVTLFNFVTATPSTKQHFIKIILDQ